MGGEKCSGVRLWVFRYVGYLPECRGMGDKAGIGVDIRGRGDGRRGGILLSRGGCR